VVGPLKIKDLLAPRRCAMRERRGLSLFDEKGLHYDREVWGGKERTPGPPQKVLITLRGAGVPPVNHLRGGEIMRKRNGRRIGCTSGGFNVREGKKKRPRVLMSSRYDDSGEKTATERGGEDTSRGLVFGEGKRDKEWGRGESEKSSVRRGLNSNTITHSY